jgi:hypothetical protein
MSGQSPFQTYDAWETLPFGRVYRLDGAFMASEKDEFIYRENRFSPAPWPIPGPASNPGVLRICGTTMEPSTRPGWPCPISFAICLPDHP